MKIQMTEFYTGKKGDGKTLTVLVSGMDADKLIEQPDGNATLQLAVKEVTHKSYPLLARIIIRYAKQTKAQTLIIPVDELITRAPDYGTEKAFEVLVTNLLLAEYAYDVHITDKKRNHHVANCIITTDRLKMLQTALKKGLQKGMLTNEARELINTPACDMTPLFFANYVKKMVPKQANVSVKVFAKKDLQKMGANAILAVGAGSPSEPCMVVVEYKGAKPKDEPIVLVGKGITFDTGGVNVKPGDSMHQMHMDMTGAASVLQSFIYAVNQKVQKNIVAIMCVAENSVSGTSYRVNDIIKTLSGKTVEVLNTDAEGRLVLADGIAYADKYKPAVILTAATLTGAAIVALGQRLNAMFASDDGLAKDLYNAGWLSHDYCWHMPLWSEFEKDMQGTVSDLANIPPRNSRAGGTITAASFLHQFAKPHRFGHIDCAPRMTAIEEDKLAFGATGSPTLMFMEYLES